MQDFDAAYTIDVLSDSPEEKIVELTKNKGRGNSIGSVAYAFDNRPEVSYAERLASVREIEPDQHHSLRITAAQANDIEVIESIKAAICTGSMSKMELAVYVSTKVSIGRNKVVNLLERYQGTDPTQHLWYFETGAHGRKTYQLHLSPLAG